MSMILTAICQAVAEAERYVSFQAKAVVLPFHAQLQYPTNVFPRFAYAVEG